MSDQLPIPFELITHFSRGNCVLFLGTDYNAVLPTGNMPPGRQSFIQKLAKGVIDLIRPDSDPWKIADAYEMKYGRQALVAALKTWIEETGREPYPIHHAIAALPLEAIITTAYDDRLEQALRATGKSPVTVATPVDVSFVGADKVLVLKLFGDVEQPDSLVLTGDDQRKLKARLTPLLSVVRYLFVIKTLFFVGYDLEDELFNDLYAEVTYGTGKYRRRGYAVCPSATDLDRRLWDNKGVQLIEAKPAPFLSQLQAQLAELPAKEPKKPQTLDLLNRPPYKFLDFFKPEDTEIFFGRETESLLLWRKILSYRLVVLFGPSGAGKTSLLNAGVWPELAQYDYRVCSARVHTEPWKRVREEVAKALPPGRRVGSALSRLPPADEDLHSYFSRVLKPEDRMVVLLDQFEELFITAASDVQDRFLCDLAACLRDNSRELRFVLSMREDFLPHLESYRDRLLQHYANSLRLEPLNRTTAELAIIEPARRVGLAYEPDLIESLLDDLEESGRVAPPQLQIICDKLYRNVAGQALEKTAQSLGERLKSILGIGKPAQKVRAMVTVDQYHDLGGAETILAKYVDEVIAELPANQRERARDLLKAMITAEETKAVLSQAEIVARSGVGLETVGQVLKNLVDYRLVRRMGGEEGPRYELAHEHLIAKIRSWVTPEELEAEMVRRLLDQQMVRYREFGGLIDSETLQRINQQRENPYLTITSSEEQELLFRSALEAGYQVGYWFERAREAGVDVDAIARAGLKSDDFRARSAAVQAVAQLALQAQTSAETSDVSETSEVLIGMLVDDYPKVRVAAIAALEALQPDGAWRAHLKRECYVPAGKFMMGEDDELHEVSLDAYYIGRYPVTNADYKQYKDDVGQPFEIPEGKADHPVVYVPWYDARDYAAWAGMRLLTEAEWEKAASWEGERGRVGERGIVDKLVGAISRSYPKTIPEGKKRKYPWGDEFDVEKCNTEESGIGTTKVGKYSPEGDSPYGCVDMAGNVWEWTSSLYQDYPYRADDGREDMSSSDRRVVRGGSFYNAADFARCAYRYEGYPLGRVRLIGFRVGVGVVAAPFSPTSEL
jgi:formylglycine-generating enzyme required for sulfatase activity